QARFCNVASTCARSPLDRRFWISASESHPEYLQRSRHCLYLHSDSQTEAPRCFFLAQTESIAFGYRKKLRCLRQSLQGQATLSSSSPIAFASAVSVSPISAAPLGCRIQWNKG